MNDKRKNDERKTISKKTYDKFVATIGVASVLMWFIPLFVVFVVGIYNVSVSVFTNQTTQVLFVFLFILFCVGVGGTWIALSLTDD